MTAAQRFFDLALAVLLLPVAVPVTLAGALLVKLTSDGPAIFAQDRVGYRQSVFRCYKLRTMTVGTRTGLSHEVGTSHITPVGRWLRRLKVDELPQLWNVFRGDMRFVGPRPGLPGDKALIAAREKAGVFEIVPGITGLAQVNGVDMSDPEKLAAWDARYMQTASIGTDLKLIVQTAIGGGRGDATTRK